jgi:hypothetical protein
MATTAVIMRMATSPSANEAVEEAARGERAVPMRRQDEHHEHIFDMDEWWVKEVESRGPRYLVQNEDAHDDMALTAEAIAFTFQIRAAISKGQFHPESFPYIYLSAFPDMFNGKSREQLIAEAEHNLSSYFKSNIYPIRNQKMEAILISGIMRVYHMDKLTFMSKYYRNGDAVREYAKQVLEDENIEFRGTPIFRSYPIYFPIAYDLQRKLQCEYGIRKPTCKMIALLFRIHLLKSNHIWTREPVTSFDIPGDDVTYRRVWRDVEKEDLPENHQEKIEKEEAFLREEIGNYHWRRLRTFVLSRKSLRDRAGYSGM